MLICPKGQLSSRTQGLSPAQLELPSAHPLSTLIRDMTCAERWKDAVPASLPLTPSRGTTLRAVQSKCCQSSVATGTVRYGTAWDLWDRSWSSFQDAPCRKLALTPFPYAATWDMVPGTFCPTPTITIIAAFFLVFECFVPEKRQNFASPRYPVQWEKCPKPLYGNYVHIYMRMSNGGQE